MKKVPCNSGHCKDYRAHHERQDEPRGIVLVEVPDDYEYKYGEKEAYCSLTCALIAGWISIKYCRPETDPCNARGCKKCKNEDK